MTPGLIGVEEPARALDHDVDAEVAPWQLLGCRRLQHANPTIADDQLRPDDRHGIWQSAGDAVELEKVRELVKRLDVVGCDDFEVEIVPSPKGPAQRAADPSETVDPDADRHFGPPAVVPLDSEICIVCIEHIYDRNSAV